MSAQEYQVDLIPTEPDMINKWQVTVTTVVDDRRIRVGQTMTLTEWGARREAKRMLRKYERRDNKPKSFTLYGRDEKVEV